MWELDYKESWAPKNWCFCLKEISSEYSLEGLILKLKLQYFGHLIRRTDSLEKTVRLVKVEGRRRRGQQRMRWLDGIEPGLVVCFTYDNICFSVNSLKSFHPRLLPQSRKDCSIHTSVSLLLSCIRVIITIFLNSICISILY